MKIGSCIVLAVLLSSCNEIQPSPDGQSVFIPTFPSAPPAPAQPPPEPAPPPPAPPPSSPPFTVTLQGDSAATPGRWPLGVLIVPQRGVITSEVPDVLRLTCGGQTITRSVGFGAILASCEFATIGEHQVQAVVVGSAGFEASRMMRVVITWPAPMIVTLHYSVIESSSSWTDVSFGVRTLDGASRHFWDFGDGSVSTTMLPSTRHRFTRPTSGSNERRVTVIVRHEDGRTLATGAVVGRW